MNFRILCLSFSLIVCSSGSHADAPAKPLSNLALLRKISHQLRGVDPTLQEYDQARQIQNPAAFGDFIQHKISGYQNSPGYQDRLAFRLSEKFQVKTPVLGTNAAQELAQTPGAKPFRVMNDALQDLFARMGRDNLSWDTLLTGKEYNLYPTDSFAPNAAIDDIAFFQFLVPGLQEVNYMPVDKNASQGAPTPVRFSADDPRVAGAITTARFFNRYNTTDVNKDRRRAAAVFRIFMCDAMTPVIPADADKKSADLNSAFADAMPHATYTEKQLNDALTISDSQRHGANPNCAACHRKLDPMGLTFANIGMTLNPEPAPGILTFPRPNGELVKTQVTGLGQLGQEITKLPEYVNCQVNWFWKQFIGEDVVLYPKRQQELAQAFENVGRRTGDFIRVLINAPEFRQPPAKLDHVEFAQIAPLLQSCDNCHNASYDMVPDPMAGGLISLDTLHEMQRRVNLPDSDHAKMPKDWQRWNPADLDLIKGWLNQGAPGPNGKRLLAGGSL